MNNNSLYIKTEDILAKMNFILEYIHIKMIYKTDGAITYQYNGEFFKKWAVCSSR